MWGFARFSCIQVEVQCDSRVHLSRLAIENERPVLPLPDGRNGRGHKERVAIRWGDFLHGTVGTDEDVQGDWPLDARCLRLFRIDRRDLLSHLPIRNICQANAHGRSIRKGLKNTEAYVPKGATYIDKFADKCGGFFVRPRAMDFIDLNGTKRGCGDRLMKARGGIGRQQRDSEFDIFVLPAHKMIQTAPDIVAILGEKVRIFRFEPRPFGGAETLEEPLSVIGDYQARNVGGCIGVVMGLHGIQHVNNEGFQRGRALLNSWGLTRGVAAGLWASMPIDCSLC